MYVKVEARNGRCFCLLRAVKRHKPWQDRCKRPGYIEVGPVDCELQGQQSAKYVAPGQIGATE